MAVIIGSARLGENGKITGGKTGDQKQVLTNGKDFSGEVSMQKFYVHKKGWYIIRPKSVAHADAIGRAMFTACNNPNIGYNQTDRLGVIQQGVNSKVKVNADCSTLVRACIIAGTGKDPGNFTTASQVNALAKTGLFETKIPYSNLVPLFVGDILVTKTKGHTAIVVESDNVRSGGTASGSTPAPEAPSTPVKKKSVDVIAHEVLKGLWGSGSVRKAKLTQAGYNYSEVQKKVNQLLNK